MEFKSQNGSETGFWRVQPLKILFFIGILVAFLVPPFQSPDEFNHFFRAWQVSDGNLTGQAVHARVGGEMPRQVLDFADSFRQIPFRYDQKIEFKSLIHAFKNAERLSISECRFTDFPNTAVYAPTAYLPQSFAIFLGKKMDLPVIWLFYAARILNFLVWWWTIYASLQVLKSVKWARDLLLILAVLPSSIFMAATCSADVLTNATSFLLLSVCFLLIFDEKASFTPLHLALILGGGILLSWNKLAYLPILGLVGFIDVKKFKSVRQKYSLVIGFWGLNVLVIVGWIWTLKTRGLLLDESNYAAQFIENQQVTRSGFAQFVWIFENPLAYFKILTSSLLKTAPHTWIHYVGKFGWEKNYLPIPILVFWTVWIGLNLPPPSIDVLKKRFLRYKLVLIGVLTTVSFATTMYALWSYVGAGFIENLAGKYFIPIFPLFLMSFSIPPTIYKFLNIEKLIAQKDTILGGGILVSGVAMIWSIWTRYYF